MVANQQLKPGVFLANTIVKNKGIGHLMIMNTLDNEVTINSILFLLNELNFDTTEDCVKQTIIDIYKSYADIFHVSGDPFTVKNI